MRGFPLLNLLVCLGLAFAVVAPLVRRMTVVAAPPPPAAAVDTSGSVEASVRFRCVHAPRSLAVTAAGRPLARWENAAGDLAFEERVALPWEARRTEFTVTASWPDGTPETVIEVTIEPDGLEARTTNLWSSGGTLEEIVGTTWPAEVAP